MAEQKQEQSEELKEQETVSNLAAGFAVTDEEIDAVERHLASLDLRVQREGSETQIHFPNGMDAQRFQFVLWRTMQQKSGNLFACVDEAFSHEWVDFGKADFDALRRSRQTHHSLISHDTVKNIYETIWKAATNEENGISNSPNTMKIAGVNHARLCAEVEMVADAAHLCPKSASDCKTDTWVYVALAVLGLPAGDIPTQDEILTMRKGLRGCLAPKPNSNTGNQGHARRTMDNTGLNRSPCNLLSTMDQKYIFDSSACLYVLPVMDLAEAKAWDGNSYSVLILCDNDKNRRATHQDVADRVGLSKTNAAAATSEDVSKAIELLSCVMRFSAYALENMPAPPVKLWEKLKVEVVQGRSLYSSITGVPVEDLEGKIIIPTEKELDRKIIAKVDLRRSSRGLQNVVFPDPILLACKTSVNWSRKFGFRLIAEAEPDEQFWPNGDGFVGKNIDISSFDSESKSEQTY